MTANPCKWGIIKMRVNLVLKEFKPPVNGNLVRFIYRGFKENENGAIKNIKIFRAVPQPKNALIDLVHVSSEKNLKENWKIIESLYGVSYQPAVK